MHILCSSGMTYGDRTIEMCNPVVEILVGKLKISSPPPKKIKKSSKWSSKRLNDINSYIASSQQLQILTHPQRWQSHWRWSRNAWGEGIEYLVPSNQPSYLLILPVTGLGTSDLLDQFPSGGLFPEREKNWSVELILQSKLWSRRLKFSGPKFQWHIRFFHPFSLHTYNILMMESCTGVLWNYVTVFDKLL